MSKLTLSVDDAVVARAKRYAQKNGVSVSSMVEAYLDAVTESRALPVEGAPVFNALRGTLKGANLGDYKRYLETKYR
jgi:antitoxin component of RelBE/YafQ-DinJ toxin-antitoxin module